jgi:hypothetical protein
MPLEALQADFSAAMFDARRAPTLLPELKPRGERTLELIGLYRGNLLAAWQKALANAFPVVRALVGDEFFEALARVYGHAHPSASGDLNRFGEHFAAFVADFEHTRELPYLGDVAALEWIVHRAHYALDSIPISRHQIARLLPHELLASRFGLNPACAWLDSGYPVAQIWLAHQSGTDVALPESLERGDIALVARPQWRVEVVRSSAGEIAALEKLRDGETLATAIEAALEEQPGFDFAKALPRWLDLSLLTRPRIAWGN